MCLSCWGEETKSSSDERGVEKSVGAVSRRGTYSSYRNQIKSKYLNGLQTSCRKRGFDLTSHLINEMFS